MMRWGRLNYSQEYIDLGCKELTLPPTAGGDFAIPTNYLHTWPPITDLSLSYYMEMHAHFNSWSSLLRVYLDNTLHALLPRTFMPVETMLSYTRLPYHSVHEQSQRQRNIINKTLLIIAISSVGVLRIC